MMIFIVVISKRPQGSFKKKYFNEVLKSSIISGNSCFNTLYKSKEKKINQSQLNIKKNTFQVLGQSISHPSVYIKPLNNWMIYEDWVKMYHQKCCNHQRYILFCNRKINWLIDFLCVPSSPYILYKINYKIKFWNIYHKSLIIEAVKTPTKFPIQRCTVN